MNLSKAAYAILTYIAASSCLISTDASSSSKTCKEGASSAAACTNLDFFKEPPFVAPRIFLDGNILPLDNKEATTETETPTWTIHGCCSKQGIGELPQMSTTQSETILQNAIQGWNNGQGTWTQMSLADRITHIRTFVDELKKQRAEIIRVLMWEIGKNYVDAKSEFDRTIVFIEKAIEAIESVSSSDEYNVKSTFTKIGSTNVFKRRNGFGIILCLGPYNYPLNETYATMIPALLMGNILILKIPQVGGLSHLLSFEAFAKALPPNTIHFISGSGRKTLPPLMTSGKVDGLAFIGGTNAADLLIKQHPEPHRLKIFLQLEAKNMAIVLKDLCERYDSSSNGNGGYDLSKAVDDIITGSLSYNGQRCTALKIIYVPKGYGSLVSKMIADRVEKMNIGFPWDTHHDNDTKGYSQITPLPNEGRIKYMKELMEDATANGANIINDNGGSIVSSTPSTSRGDENDVYSTENLMIPAVLFPVTSQMKIFKEEQFGPLIPVVEYDSLDEVLQYGSEGIYGQQVSIFTHEDSENTSTLVDAFSSIFGKINVNSQCGRSPDNVPFSARRSSGMGVMSIEDALREFSVPTVVSFKEGTDANIVKTMEGVQNKSVFMANL